VQRLNNKEPLEPLLVQRDGVADGGGLTCGEML
jgi:hypothetical protein